MTLSTSLHAQYGTIPTIENNEEYRDDEARHTQSYKAHALVSIIVTALVVLVSGISPPLPAMLTLAAGGNRGKTKKDGKLPPHYYKYQSVDHLSKHDRRTFTNRYFVHDDHFKGPGHPIFVVMGGEDPLDGVLYPFVFDRLAKTFGGITLGIEHRFFGTSQPIKKPTDKELRKLMTPHQAIEDVVQLVQWKRKKLGCSLDRKSKHYCPIVSVGGSYPGFMAAVLRINYPHIIDIGYAASAPMNLYSHSVTPTAYFDKVSAVAELAVPGCVESTRKALYQLHDYMTANAEMKDVKEHARQLGICSKLIPDYILNADSPITMLLRETNAIVASHFAEANMEYYPPANDTELAQACRIFTNESDTFLQKVAKFMNMREQWWDQGCFDMHSELPSGKHATISSTDWSGMGDGDAATMWEILSCQLLPECSISDESMFYPREWTLDFVTERCETRFGLKPDVDGLVNELHFDDLKGVTRLLFTNGIRDGWEVASITASSADGGVVAINMVNGAHHSDLMHGPVDDTPDVVEAHSKIEALIGKWLKEI